MGYRKVERRITPTYKCWYDNSVFDNYSDYGAHLNAYHTRVDEREVDPHAHQVSPSLIVIKMSDVFGTSPVLLTHINMVVGWEATANTPPQVGHLAGLRVVGVGTMSSPTLIRTKHAYGGMGTLIFDFDYEGFVSEIQVLGLDAITYIQGVNGRVRRRY